jgi:hypothetical protein
VKKGELNGQFAIFNNDQEVKEFIAKLHFDDVLEVEHLAIIIDDSDPDAETYKEFNEDKDCIVSKDANSVVLDSEIWYNYPLVCYFEFTEGEYDGYALHLFELCPLSELQRAMEETVTISKKEYERLEREVYFLECLRMEGVDNCEGYEYALKSFKEVYGEDE